jgi:glycosyltransferase involved in cell wall biosynthesis
MKICLIAPVPPFRGGIAKYCYSLAQELEKRHDLMLLSYKRQYPELLYGKKSQIDPNISREDIAAEFKQLSYDIDSASIFSWVVTSKKIASFDPDLVILPWWVTYWAPMYAYLLSSLKKKGIKVVFICINVFEHEDHALKKSVTKFILRRADSIIVHSEQEKCTLLEINPKAAVEKHLMPLFEYDSSAPLRQDKSFRLLFFGFVRPYKGLDVLIKAIGILRDYDISLEIVGEFWNDKNEYITLIKDLGISSKVTILDTYVPSNEMSQYFSRADLVVLPYRKSITSGVIATAYGFKKPVLATNVGGFYEVIQDGCTGKIVTSDDPQSFADGIIWFLENKQINFAENISTFSTQHMSWKSLVDVVEGFYLL